MLLLPAVPPWMLLLILLLALLIPPLLDADDDDEDDDDDDDDEEDEDEDEDLEVLLPGKSRRIWPIFCSLSDFPATVAAAAAAAVPELPPLDARCKLLVADVADSRWLPSAGRGMVPLPPPVPLP